MNANATMSSDSDSRSSFEKNRLCRCGVKEAPHIESTTTETAINRQTIRSHDFLQSDSPRLRNQDLTEVIDSPYEDNVCARGPAIGKHALAHELEIA